MNSIKALPIIGGILVAFGIMTLYSKLFPKRFRKHEVEWEDDEWN